MTCTIASGTLSYSDITNIVEALIYTEGRRFVIPGIDFEDIAQEIRLECVRVISDYDPSRIGPVPFKFFQICVRNRLYNMRRGIYVPNNPPCVRCEFWDKNSKSCLINELNCQEIIDYRKGMATKAAIRTPKSLPENKNVNAQDFAGNDIIDYKSGMSIEAKILDEDIRSVLPKSLIPKYEKMISGHEAEVSIRDKKRIRLIVKDLIKDA